MSSSGQTDIQRSAAVDKNQSFSEKCVLPANQKMDSDSISIDSRSYDTKTVSEIVPPNSNTLKKKALGSVSSTASTPRKSPRSISGKTPAAKLSRPQSVKCHNTNSSIPLPVKGAASVSPTPVSMMSKVSIRSRVGTASKINSFNNKHTLEIQFINKKKRLNLMTQEIVEKQKPIIDLYSNLLSIKKKLEALGRSVQLQEIKLIPYSEDLKLTECGETINPEMVDKMKNSIEEIPKTLMSICQNLLSRRAVIVELLESVTKSEVDVTEMSDKIDSLKTEGGELQKSLDAIINDHEKKINDLVVNWQTLLNQTQNDMNNEKVEGMQIRIREQERLALESQIVIQDLQRKLDDKRLSHDKSVTELESLIKDLRDKIYRLEQDIDNERKLATDHKTRNNTNAHTIKMLKNKIAELETKSKESDDKNNDLNRRMKHAQDSIRTKESQWSKEKEELSKKLKDQENLLQKLQTDKNEFETRCHTVEESKVQTEGELRECIFQLRNELAETKIDLEKAVGERDEVNEKFNQMQEQLVKSGRECKQHMELVAQSVNWGKATPSTEMHAEEYAVALVNDIKIRELEDKVQQYELERRQFCDYTQKKEDSDGGAGEEDNQDVLSRQKECISRYQELLQQSEDKLREKSMEVAKLTAEIRQLKVRQTALEEQNSGCPAGDLQKMLEEGRAKLSELMNKSMESEQKIANYESIIEKQNTQMNEMENLIRYRENMSGVMKASRDELLAEKESLTRYSHEMRQVLTELSKDGKIKDRTIKDLQEKLDLREKQISKLEKDVRDLEANLQMTNEKRFKLQASVNAMEKELQSHKAHAHQMNDIQTRTRSQIRDRFKL